MSGTIDAARLSFQQPLAFDDRPPGWLKLYAKLFRFGQVFAHAIAG